MRVCTVLVAAATILVCTFPMGLLSTWNGKRPQHRCTAISSGVAFEVWSIYFYVRTVWGEQREDRRGFFRAVVAVLCAVTVGASMVFYLCRAAIYTPETVELIGQILYLG